MLRRSVSAFFTVSLLFGLLAGAAKAQTSNGTIVGHIQDTSGAAVPGAQVTVTNLGTNVSYRYTTGNAGDYYLPSLLPGRYRVEAEKTGFKKEVADSVTVDVNQTVREDFTLQVGQTTQTVEVVATAPMLQTDQATLGSVITNRTLTDLPISGRDFTNLIRLSVGTGEMQGGISTGATIRLHGYDDDWKLVSVDGSRPGSVDVVIDGVPTNDEFFQSPANVPVIDAIQEFRLQSGLYSADFGMGAAQVSVAVKSGTNSLHGDFWDFFRNEALQPANPRAPYLNATSSSCQAAIAKYGKIQIPPCTNPRPPFEQNQWGFTLGGPVWFPHVYEGKDRTFWFFNYQGGRRLTSSLGQAQVPTAAELTGNFTDWPTTLYDPLGGTSGSPAMRSTTFTPNNVIPASRIAAVSKNLLPYWPAANITCTLPCLNYQNTVETNVPMAQYLIRLDHNIGQSDRIFGEYMWQKQTQPSPSIIPLSGALATQMGELGTLRWAHSFGPRTLNEAWVGVNRVNFFQGIQTAFGSTNYWSQVGLTNLWIDPVNNALPGISLGTNYSGVGYGGTAPIYNIVNTFQYADNLTMTRGRQTMKMGIDFRRNQGFEKNGSNSNGVLTFGGNYTAASPTATQTAGAANTGNGFADFLLGYLTSVPKYQAWPQTLSQLRNTDYMLFYEDDVRVTPQLTLNLGLRYELHTPFHDITDGGSVFNFSAPGGARIWANSAYAGLVNNTTYYGCCVSPNLINTDYHDWAPRVGFAWRPWRNNNKFVVRGGYGIFYDTLMQYYNTQSVSWDVPYIEPTLPTPNETESAPPLYIGNMFPAPYTIAGRTFPAPHCTAPSANIFNAAGTEIVDISNYCPNPQTQLPDNKTPSLQQWGLNVEYAVTPTTMVELGYQGSHGVHEPIQWIFNQGYPVPSADVGFAANSDQYDSQCTGTNVLNVNCFPTQDRVPYKNFLQTSFANANILSSKYEAMTFKVDKRYSHGVQTLISFTWAHAIDQFSEIQAQSGTISSIASDAHNLQLMWGSAAFDETRRLVVSGVYDLPVGKGKAFLNRGGVVDKILGGWQTNGVLTLSDGPPFDIGCGCGDREQVGNSYNVQKPDTTSTPPLGGFTRNVYEWFNPAAFTTPPLGTLGNFGRDVLRTTHQTALDFSAFKNNKITERVNLQFRAEIFNLPSSETYLPLFPSNSLSSSTFGSIISKAQLQDSGSLFNPRVIQLSLKLVF